MQNCWSWEAWKAVDIKEVQYLVARWQCTRFPQKDCETSPSSFLASFMESELCETNRVDVGIHYVVKTISYCLSYTLLYFHYSIQKRCTELN